MKIEISKIKVMNRIRKEVLKIDELAANIKQNGLITPIAVMVIGDGEYQLLAGLRRLKAMISIGETEIEARVYLATSAESALKIEYSENEQREEFTFSERLDYARLIEEIEKAKSLDRKSIGGQGGFSEDRDLGTHLHTGRSRDIIGGKIGMSGRQYERAKFIAENAPPEIIEQLDSGKRTIRGTYDELRREEKQVKPVSEKPKTLTKTDKLKALDDARIAAAKQFNSLSPDGKIAELTRQLADEKAKSARLQGEYDDYRSSQHNQIIHRDSIIENLKLQITELETALSTANDRIKILEETYEPDKHTA
jgi:ParB family chromosome partitioning protein